MEATLSARTALVAAPVRASSARRATASARFVVRATGEKAAVRSATFVGRRPHLTAPPPPPGGSDLTLPLSPPHPAGAEGGDRPEARLDGAAREGTSSLLGGTGPSFMGMRGHALPRRPRPRCDRVEGAGRRSIERQPRGTPPFPPSVRYRLTLPPSPCPAFLPSPSPPAPRSGSTGPSLTGSARPARSSRLSRWAAGA